MRVTRKPMRALAALLAMLLAACRAEADSDQWRFAAAATGGDPARGRALMRPFGCAACHTIPGVAGAGGQVGPPLGGIAGRSYIGGVIENDPQNMVRWILNPKAIDAKTAMPMVGATEEQARHMAAYLYTLR